MSNTLHGTAQRRSLRASNSRQLKTTQWRLRPLCLALSLGIYGLALDPARAGAALPTGLTVVNGRVSTSQSGSALTVSNSNGAVLNWQGFSIGSGNSVVFQQPSASSQVLNRVTGQDPSAILGTLQSNGKVWLINPNGVLFGSGARIDVAGLVASSLDIANADFINGRYLLKAAAGTPGTVINQGTITTPYGGQVFLVGPQVQNSGSIQTPGGQTALLGSSQVELVDNGTPFMSVRAPMLDGQVQNTGAVAAQHIDIYGAAVNQDGSLTASRLQTNASGQVVLVAANNAVLGATSQVSASGGSVHVTAGNLASVGGTISVADAAGAGGSIAISAASVQQYGMLDASGQNAGGTIAVNAAQRVVQTASARLDASSSQGAGGQVRVQAAPLGTASMALSERSSVLSSASINVSGQSGGSVTVLGDDLYLLAATVDAHGASQGGSVRIGGDFHGANAALANALTASVNATSSIDVSATQSGNAGTAVVWSEQQTQYAGTIHARGGALAGNGGAIEVSGKGAYQFAGMVDAGAPHGVAGSVLLDPKNITVDAAGGLPAFQLIDPNPSPNNEFGTTTVVLANGNVVVPVPMDSLGAANAGAVYVFNGQTGALISSLLGSQVNDQIGSNGITQLTNGNYVIASPNWANGAATQAGAATWGSGSTGAQGIISAANSLVGSQAGDSVGSLGVTALTNGNYVVTSQAWANGSALYAGAVSWGNGASGTQGLVSASNSLVGTRPFDYVGALGTTALTNGNYVVGSPYWANGGAANAGAATWGNGTTGIRGEISAANSLVGLQSSDQVSLQGITALKNGNYLVDSANWANGTAAKAGAVTWVNGTTGLAGTVSALNSYIGLQRGDTLGSGGTYALTNGAFLISSPEWSDGSNWHIGALTYVAAGASFAGAISSATSLVGAQNYDRIGSGGVTLLSNGNYVVASPDWHNGTAAAAGAVTWVNGTTGPQGVVSASNSLVGSQINDSVGAGGITALHNGNYLVQSPYWANGAATWAGAVTWGSGATGIRGVVSASNSLVGSQTNDMVGNGVAGITELANGNYVVNSSEWSNGAATWAGAVTWGNGATGIQGVVSASNSLVGSQSYDEVGTTGITALRNGNYVVASSRWANGATNYAGAVTWANGSTGIQGAVSAANSLVGSQLYDGVGSYGITALANGNYVVDTPFWSDGALSNVGAVTWANGTSGVQGVISASNSLIGSQAGDMLGNYGIAALANGNYVVASPNWANGAATQVGAVTWANGTTGIQGVVSVGNSLVGSQTGDRVGSCFDTSCITALTNGNYVVASDRWANGAAVYAGAATWGNGTTGIQGVVSASNSLVGSQAGDSVGSFITALPNGNYVVRSVGWANGSATGAGAVTWGNGTTGIQGAVSAANSLVGTQTNDDVGSIITVLTNGNYVIGSPNWANGAASAAGAVTWGSGTAGVQGVVSASNSLVGSRTNDYVGDNGVTALSNGNYVVASANWANGSASMAGAVTWGNGATGTRGVVSASNSLMGAQANDQVGSNGVTALSNGNYVAFSSFWANGLATQAGAVSWGNGSVGTQGVVSASNSLVGSLTDDLVGGQGITALSNGNYVVSSLMSSSMGAVNWSTGAQAITGVVSLPYAISPANSLVGSHTGDQVGTGELLGSNGIHALTNGNYVVSSPLWANGALAQAGAVTWGNGSSGTDGVVSAGNSLVGAQANDQVGISGIYALTNGNYVVASDRWANAAALYAGAVTWGSGASGIQGVVSASNSLVGALAGDYVGSSGVTALSNGNYVVTSPNWSDGLVQQQVGAVTWGSGTTGVWGLVSASNSLVGSQPFDWVGLNGNGNGVTALSNGNYVVSSCVWANGAEARAGAVTWGNGATGISGPVSASNSLVGSQLDDRVGVYNATALSNGNYVVSSYMWANGTVSGAGAVTWGNGATGIQGLVSATNSLVGSQLGDQVGIGGVTALKRGNYVVTSSAWANGTANQAGAVTWGNGASGISGAVSASNSLVGTQTYDRVGYNEGIDGITALANGNYVVRSNEWANGAAAQAGAVTWGDGSKGVMGSISAANSLLGKNPGDQLGSVAVIASPLSPMVLVGSPLFNGGSGRIDVMVPGAASFASASAASEVVSPDWLTAIANTGTAVVLQANNDITVNSAITTTAGGHGGGITLQAGRSILINANITTDNGALLLSANDPNANPVYRDAGVGAITMAASTAINTGSGVLDANLNGAASSITLRDVSAGALTASGALSSLGTTALSSLSLTGGDWDVISGATLNISGVASIGTGHTLAVSGGTLSAGSLAIGGSVNQTAGSLSAGATSVGSGGVLNLAGGSASFSSTLDVLVGGTLTSAQSGTTTVAGAASNAGNVAVNAGTLNLAGGYTQTAGRTTLGTSVAAPANLSAGGAGVQLSGGTLGGSGVITGNVSVGSATLAPGFSPGSITVNGNMQLSAASTLAIELGGVAPGTGYDVLNVSGSLGLNGTVSVSQFGAFVPAATDTFNYLNFGSSTGALTGVNFVGAAGTWGLGNSVLASGMQLSVVPVLPPVTPPAAPAGGPVLLPLGSTSATASTVGNTSLWPGFSLGNAAASAPATVGGTAGVAANPVDTGSSTAVAAQASGLASSIGYGGVSTAILDITPATGLGGGGTSANSAISAPGASALGMGPGNQVTLVAGTGGAGAGAGAGGASIANGAGIAGTVPNAASADTLQGLATLNALPSYRFMVSDPGTTFFRVLPLNDMESPDVAQVLGSRKAYKKALFASSIALLEANPALPDMGECAAGAAASGGCLFNAKGDGKKPVQDSATNVRVRAQAGGLAQISEKRAVVLGINHYADKRIPQLIGAVPDVNAIAQMLEQQMGYQVTVIREGSKRDMFEALNHLASEAKESDSVLVYYAGHGEMVDSTGFGYWIPSDANADKPETWFSNADLNRLLAKLPSKQIAVVADSCYSGRFALESGVDGGAATSNVEDLLQRRAVTMMTSGGDEPVADTGKDGHSVFAWELIDQLHKLPGWARGARVYDAVRVAVERELPQTPQYGASLSAGHEPGADFLFEKRAMSATR